MCARLSSAASNESRRAERSNGPPSYGQPGPHLSRFLKSTASLRLGRRPFLMRAPCVAEPRRNAGADGDGERRSRRLDAMPIG